MHMCINVCIYLDEFMRMYCMYVWIVSYYQDTFLSVQYIKYIKFLT